MMSTRRRALRGKNGSWQERGATGRHPKGVRAALVSGVGGAGRDRTDDLKLAKLPLSQLSYSPVTEVHRGGLRRHLINGGPG